MANSDPIADIQPNSLESSGQPSKSVGAKGMGGGQIEAPHSEGEGGARAGAGHRMDLQAACPEGVEGRRVAGLELCLGCVGAGRAVAVLGEWVMG